MRTKEQIIAEPVVISIGICRQGSCNHARCKAAMSWVRGIQRKIEVKQLERKVAQEEIYDLY